MSERTTSGWDAEVRPEDEDPYQSDIYDGEAADAPDPEGDLPLGLLDVFKYILGTPLRAQPKAVALALLKYASFKTWKCWPLVDTLARNAGASRQQVFKVLRFYEELGLLSREPHPTKRSNLYRLEVEEWMQFDRTLVPQKYAHFLMPERV